MTKSGIMLTTARMPDRCLISTATVESGWSQWILAKQNAMLVPTYAIKASNWKRVGNTPMFIADDNWNSRLCLLWNIGA